MSDVTQLLSAIEAGDPRASGELWPLVDEELRRLAAGKMARENAGLTLQPTALVHEAWLRLGGDEQPNWENRAHFFGAAAEAMRRILVDPPDDGFASGTEVGKSGSISTRWRSPRRPPPPRTFSP